MLVQRHYTLAQLKQHFAKSNMDRQWAQLLQAKPRFHQYLWSAFGSLTKRKEIPSTDDSFFRLRTALLTLVTVLGVDAATEIMTVGQNPVLLSLFNIEELILHRNLVENHLDLHMLLCATAVRAISYNQTFDAPNRVMTQLLNEFEFLRPVRRNVVRSLYNVGVGIPEFD